MCKSVRFSPKPIILKATYSTKFSQIRKDALWYNKNELKIFRIRAKEACKILSKRKLSSFSDVHHITETSGIVAVNEFVSNNCTRGLEVIIDAERKKRKTYANKIIITAQETMEVDDLAALSSTLSKWAIENAIKAAAFDALEVCTMCLN